MWAAAVRTAPTFMEHVQTELADASWGQVVSALAPEFDWTCHTTKTIGSLLRYKAVHMEVPLYITTFLNAIQNNQDEGMAWMPALNKAEKDLELTLDHLIKQYKPKSPPSENKEG